GGGRGAPAPPGTRGRAADRRDPRRDGRAWARSARVPRGDWPGGAKRGRRDRCRRAGPLLRPGRLGAGRGRCARARTRARVLRGCDPREGVAVGRARVGRGRADRGGCSMTRVLVGALIALIVSILIGPRFIDFLRKNEFGQHIREEGPEHHFAKSGTPTMGGLMILFAATVAFLAVSRYTLQGLTVLFATLACGAVGFLDDFIKLTHKRSLGLSGRWKLLLLGVIAAIVGIVAHHLQIEHEVYLPIVNVQIPLSYVWYPFLFLIIAGTANGTNLADGIDGLAAGT